MAKINIHVTLNDFALGDASVSIENPFKLKSRETRTGGRQMGSFDTDEGWILPNAEAGSLILQLIEKVPYAQYDRASKQQFIQHSKTRSSKSYKLTLTGTLRLYAEFLKLWDKQFKDVAESVVEYKKRTATEDNFEEMDWTIVAIQEVLGKSKGPKGYDRFKPVKYKNGSKIWHNIVYAMNFEGTAPEILDEFDSVQKQMARIPSNLHVDYVSILLVNRFSKAVVAYRIVVGLHQILESTKALEETLKAGPLFTLEKWGVI